MTFLASISASRGLKSQPVLPGLESFKFNSWEAPRPADVAAGLESNEDNKIESVINSPLLGLTDTQKESVRNFVQIISNETTATLGGLPEFEKISRVKVIDYKNQRGGRCEVALQNGIDSHLIRFGYQIQLASELGEEAEQIILGITCLGKVAGISKSQIALIRGLNNWIKDSSVRWLRRQMQNAIAQSLTIEEFTKAWRRGFEFDKFQTAIQRVLSDPTKFNNAYHSETARLRFAGRTISAVKASAYLLAAGLPVPHELVVRVLRGAKRLA